MNVTPKANILLIDDQPARLLSYEVILESLGQNLVRAGSGTDALKLLMADDYAVILLDVNMPEMDGFETATLIHQHPRYENTPIIFVTGVNLSDMDRLKGYELGAVDYVLVPVVPQILRAKVSVLVELYNKRRELQTLNADLGRANAQLAELNELLRHEKARELDKLNESLRTANQDLIATNLELKTETAGRQKVQLELDRSAAVLRAINESTQVLIIVKDRDGRVIMANPASMRAIGRDSDAIIGKTTAEFLDHQESAQLVMDNDRRVIQSGQAAVFEEAIRFPAGLRICLSTKSPYRNPEGAVEGVITVSVDITKQKDVEDALKQADRGKDEFLAMLSHELRNPLAPLHMVAELMGTTHVGSARRDEMLDIMRRQIRVLIRLVDDLMDVSRFTQGKILLKTRSVDLRDVIRDGIEVSRSLIEGGNHHFSVDLPAAPVIVSVDDVRIAQIVANLLNNAAKYTQDGGNIRLALEYVDAGLAITVTDDGCGIPADFLSKIFSRFVQVEGSRTRAQGGLGIGLSLVHDLVKLHGGRVSVTSAGVGKGSEFIVFLPTASTALEAPKESSAKLSPATATRQERVLLVDDNESACEALAMALELFDTVTSIAHSGMQALDVIETFRPTIVILDLGLPGMDGHELARKIRELASIEQPRLITISGWGDDEVRRRSREAGIEQHLVKPVALKDIEHIFASAPG